MEDTTTRGDAGIEGSRRVPPALKTRSPHTRAEDLASPIKRISLELTRTCNLKCAYCYSGASPEPRRGLDDQEIRAIIDEAVDAGARLVSIVGGGEPLVRPSLLVDGQSCIDYANRLGCYCCLYTNCTLVDDEAARWLFERDVTVVGKLNSLRDDVQDLLTGVAGSARRMRRGVDALLRAGFADSDPPRLALQSIICRQNFDELPAMWRWMRRRQIVPEVEIPTIHGRAAENQGMLYFDEEEAPEKYRMLFEELLAIDRAEFGYDWIAHPPFVGASCQLYYSNCYVNDRGGVQPCAGVDREVGTLRVGPRKDEGRSLREIVDGAEFERLRCVHLHVKGRCASCDLLGSCYGCRAAAWHHSGDIFGEDPVCWHHREPASRQPGEPASLPSAPCDAGCASKHTRSA